MNHLPHSPAARGTPRFGFTLVELLVVIGIIALLISILLPALNKARQQANTLKCLANLQQMGHLVQLYAGNNKNSLPIGYWNGDPKQVNYNAYQATDWTLLLANVLDNKIATDYQHSVSYSASNPGVHALFICPSAEAGTTNGLITHYSAHPRLMASTGTLDKYPTAILGQPTGLYMKPYKLTMIKRSSEVALIFDGSLKNDSGGTAGQWGASVTAFQLDDGRLTYSNYLIDDPKADTASYMTLGHAINTNGNGDNPADWNKDTTQNWGNIRFRHGARVQANVLFCDGHCETETVKSFNECTLTRAAVDVNWVGNDVRLN